LNSRYLFAAILAVVLAAGLAVVLGGFGGADRAVAGDRYSAPGLKPMSVEDARGDFFRLTPALLLVVYDAFGQSEEAGIYDTLAEVAHGEALEALYLERVGAMKGGGLDEADQTIHEISLLSASVSGAEDILEIDASWRVIGTVGHAEHLHVRGNTYRANLTVAPVDRAWKITGFDLVDVSRDGAGETFLASEGDG